MLEDGRAGGGYVRLAQPIAGKERLDPLGCALVVRPVPVLDPAELQRRPHAPGGDSSGAQLGFGDVE
jgi:hypothetical protein